ncbi:MAG: SCO1664 family protein [Chloroflexi bacterium]|nr:SCO1664 family protein [Chloroflexota bacterium]
MSDDIPPTSNDQPDLPPSNDASPTEDDSQIVEIERVLKLLEHGKIKRGMGRLRWSTNYTTVVQVKDAELETLAVYKPQSGERSLWDFPDGTLCYREVAAFVLSEALEWGIVPPTVLRQEGPEGVGSLQLFIQHDAEINYFSLDDSFVPQLLMMALFDCLVNNADRKGGHVLVDAQGKVWGIDHGICFHPYPKLRSVIWDFAGQPIPDELLGDVNRVVETLCDPAQGLTQTLQNLLSPDEIDAMNKRANRLLTTKKYPHPGPGPSYPWPPV